MRYINILLFWCGLNLGLIFVSYVVGVNMAYFMSYFFTGVFLILGFGMIEVIKEDRARAKRFCEDCNY